MEVGGVTPDVVPVSLQEAQLGVVQDVEVGAAQAVASGPDEEVTVVFPGLPPHGEVEGGTAQLEAGGEERVTENLFSYLAQQLDAVQRPRCSLFCQRLHEH